MNDLRLRHNIHCITSAVITVLHLRLFEIHKKIGIEKPQSINDRTLYKKIRPRDIRDFKWFLRNTDCRVDRFKSQYVFIDATDCRTSVGQSRKASERMDRFQIRRQKLSADTSYMMREIPYRRIKMQHCMVSELRRKIYSPAAVWNPRLFALPKPRFRSL